MKPKGPPKLITGNMLIHSPIWVFIHTRVIFMGAENSRITAGSCVDIQVKVNAVFDFIWVFSIAVVSYEY